MMILGLVRNYIPSYKWVIDGGWNIADCVERSYDLEGHGCWHGRSRTNRARGAAPAETLDVKLHYTDRHRLPDAVEKELNLTFHPNAESMVKVCDVVTINAPLHPETENLFNAALLAKMKRGAYLINTARGKIVNRDDVVTALKSGHLAGYAGDVWYPQPAPKDHPWRTMPHHGMTPPYFRQLLVGQTRYAAGTREILECYFDGKPIRNRVPDRGRRQTGGCRRSLLQCQRSEEKLTPQARGQRAPGLRRTHPKEPQLHTDRVSRTPHGADLTSPCWVIPDCFDVVAIGSCTNAA